VYNAQIVTERERQPERTVMTFFTKPRGWRRRGGCGRRIYPCPESFVFAKRSVA
jgi:hypothetical protein